MARHCSTWDFFQEISNALLQHYFQAQSVFTTFDFAAMPGTKPDGLFSCWLYLTEGRRNMMKAEFRDIFEASCEKGFRALMDEAP